VTIQEKDRLIEIMFYLYFDTKDEKTISSREFWDVINAVCNMYNIDSVKITEAIRLLMAEENAPQDDETYYLLHKVGLTVRPIRKLTGIYWQKQKAIEEKLAVTPIIVTRKINDVIVKRNMRDFIHAMYNLSDCLLDLGNDVLSKILT
jgi:hypothetical protein